ERGAFNFLHSLDRNHTAHVFAASAGNHALAVSYHAKLLGLPCSIVMPRFAPLVKIKSTEEFGARVTLFGNTFDEARIHAQELYANQAKTVCVPAFDHPDIIIGQ